MSINPKNVFVHYLQQLQVMLNKIEQHQQGQTDIFIARLSPTMLPFIQQVRTTANFALRACCPLANLPVISFDNDQVDWRGLEQQVTATRDYIHAIDDHLFAQQAEDRFTEKAGFADVSLPPDSFLNLYTLPNFFFHLNMVYAIARSHNIPLSKGDYDGIHLYPDDFSFEK